MSHKKILFFELDQRVPEFNAMVEEMLPEGFSLKLWFDVPESERAAVLADTDYFLVLGQVIGKDMLQAAPRLRYIQRTGQGYDNVDIAAAKELGLPVSILPTGNAVAVAEHAILLPLALLGKLTKLDAETRAGMWPGGKYRTSSFEMDGKVHGFVGFDEYGDHIIGMTEEMMDDVANAFAEAAETCKKCGFDMVQIHCGHGWLLGQFLSPLTNARTDEYGGSMENRARFPAMVVKRVRERVGRNFALDMRISGTEYVEGGSTIEDAINFVKTVEPYIDLVNISAGAPWWPGMIPSAFDPHGMNAYLAAEVKKHVKIPVTSVGGYVDPNHMESLLANGTCDGFIIGHALVADPQLPNKGLLGKDDEIRPCMRCGVCNQLMYSTREFKCSINPLAGRYSSQYDVKPAETKKKVLVIGGGPGGMQCAITAAERGHDVTLCEKSDRLGGALKFADHVSFKEDMKNYREYLIRTVNRLGVKVLLDTEVTPEWAEKFDPDALCVAVGAEPFIPPIPGVKGDNVVLSVNMFDDDVKLGHKVVIIGGGLVGCEDGLQLAYNGHDVTIVEMMGAVAIDATPKHKQALLPRLNESTTIMVNSACAEITDKGVWLTTPEGRRFVEADTVILAAGSRALTAQVDALRDVAPEFHVIGDCIRARRVIDAVRSGYDAASHM